MNAVMSRSRFRLLTVAMVLVAVNWGVHRAFAADPKPKKQQITNADRKAAAKSAAALGLKPGVAGYSVQTTTVQTKLPAPPATAVLPLAAAQGESRRDPALLRSVRELGLQPAAEPTRLQHRHGGQPWHWVRRARWSRSRTSTALGPRRPPPPFDGTGAITAITVDTASSGLPRSVRDDHDECPTGTGAVSDRGAGSVGRTRWAG